MAGGKEFVDAISINGIVEQVETVSISATLAKDMFTTPQTVVAAAATGYYNEFVSATIWYDYGDAAFGGIATNEDLQFRGGAGGAVVVSANCETTGFLDQAADEVRHVNAFSTADYEPTNGAIVLALTTNNITNAGTTSALKIKVYYRVRPLTW